MADTTAKAQKVPLTEECENEKRIPKAIFLENIEGWVEKYGGEVMVQEMNELYQKYKYMEQQQQRGRMTLKIKLPDIKKTLDMVFHMQKKHQSEEQAFNTNFLIADNIWTKAKIPNKTGKVGLWLGANVMVEYSYEEAIMLL
jgi:prefoldin subunit 5